VSSALSSKWLTDERDSGPFPNDLERKRINLSKVTLNSFSLFTTNREAIRTQVIKNDQQLR
jgi:hypothetical protein